MFIHAYQIRGRLISKCVSAFIAFTFIFTSVIPPGYAQGTPTLLNLPLPGAMVTVTPGFTPPLIKGITVHPENPLLFDFIVNSGEENVQGEDLAREATKMIKYFLATLTTPEDELWVNLSPYEKNRIIPDKLGQTSMGRDMLAMDYLLKQLTSSLMYPEDELGAEFWERVHKRAYEEYGTTEIPLKTFNKVWIVPESATLVEKDHSVYVIDSHLKVMMESDYEAMMMSNLSPDTSLPETQNVGDAGTQETGDTHWHDFSNNMQSDIIREVLIPEIEREINQGQTFAQLRQIYNSMILATWYKINLKESLLGKVYVDQNKIKGVDVADKDIKNKIYSQYLEAFSKGVYDYIKEDYDPATQEIIPRKYFSGGFAASPLGFDHISDIASRTINLDGMGQANVIAKLLPGLTQEPGAGHTIIQVRLDELKRNAAENPKVASVLRALEADEPITFFQKPPVVRQRQVQTEGAGLQPNASSPLSIVEMINRGETVNRDTVRNFLDAVFELYPDLEFAYGSRGVRNGKEYFVVYQRGRNNNSVVFEFTSNGKVLRITRRPVPIAEQIPWFTQVFGRGPEEIKEARRVEEFALWEFVPILNEFLDLDIYGPVDFQEDDAGAYLWDQLIRFLNDGQNMQGQKKKDLIEALDEFIRVVNGGNDSVLGGSSLGEEDRITFIADYRKKQAAFETLKKYVQGKSKYGSEEHLLGSVAHPNYQYEVFRYVAAAFGTKGFISLDESTDLTNAVSSPVKAKERAESVGVAIRQVLGLVGPHQASALSEKIRLVLLGEDENNWSNAMKLLAQFRNAVREISEGSDSDFSAQQLYQNLKKANERDVFELAYILVKWELMRIKSDKSYRVVNKDEVLIRNVIGNQGTVEGFYLHLAAIIERLNQKRKPKTKLKALVESIGQLLVRDDQKDLEWRYGDNLKRYNKRFKEAYPNPFEGDDKKLAKQALDLAERIYTSGQVNGYGKRKLLGAVKKYLNQGLAAKVAAASPVKFSEFNNPEMMREFVGLVRALRMDLRGDSPQAKYSNDNFKVWVESRLRSDGRRQLVFRVSRFLNYQGSDAELRQDMAKIKIQFHNQDDVQGNSEPLGRLIPLRPDSAQSQPIFEITFDEFEESDFLRFDVVAARNNVPLLNENMVMRILESLDDLDIKNSRLKDQVRRANKPLSFADYIASIAREIETQVVELRLNNSRELAEINRLGQTALRLRAFLYNQLEYFDGHFLTKGEIENYTEIEFDQESGVLSQRLVNLVFGETLKQRDLLVIHVDGVQSYEVPIVFNRLWHSDSEGSGYPFVIGLASEKIDLELLNQKSVSVSIHRAASSPVTAEEVLLLLNQTLQGNKQLLIDLIDDNPGISQALKPLRKEYDLLLSFGSFSRVIDLYDSIGRQLAVVEELKQIDIAPEGFNDRLIYVRGELEYYKEALSLVQEWIFKIMRADAIGVVEDIVNKYHSEDWITSFNEALDRLNLLSGQDYFKMTLRLEKIIKDLNARLDDLINKEDSFITQLRLRTYQDSINNIVHLGVLEDERIFTEIDGVQAVRSESSSPAVSGGKDNYGGIDFNPVLLDLQIKRDGNGIPLPVWEQPIETMNIEGFIPIIINITPVGTLPMLLGLADSPEDDSWARTRGLDSVDKRWARVEEEVAI